MAITVKSIETSNNFVFTQIKKIKVLSEKHLESLAKETEVVLKQNIKDSLQRPSSTGNLENNITSEKTGNLSWGVGNIAILNQNAPYWRWINFGIAASGRTTPPKTVGFFNPGQQAPDASSFRNGRFSKDGTGFLINPQKPIQAHNFIERTLANLPTIIAKILGRKI
jgi:hypothetical protein